MLEPLRLFSVFLLLLLFGASCAKEIALPVLFTLPEASLLNESGSTVSMATSKGTVGIYNFIFTTCAGICPMMTQRMRELTPQFEAKAPIRFYSLSVDPEIDTPAVLSAYASKVRNDSRWSFLTGERDEVIRLSIDGFKLSAGGAGAGSDRLLHTARFALVDAKGQVRGYYDSEEPDQMKNIVRDARQLFKEIH